jgi:hypothetical protein
MKSRYALPLAALLVLAAGCSQKTEETSTSTSATDSTVTAAPPASTVPDTNAAPSASTMPVKPTTPPEHIEVQHVLIGFQGSIPARP